MALLPVHAQIATGSWRQYPVHGEFSDLIDTGKGVWYVTGGCLYYYDKKDDETRFYEGGKELSDFTIRFVRYNSERDMLAVAYSNGNIDMILPDGSRVNLPEIKDATANVEKSLNDIVFDGNDMFVATAFGLVIYDLDRLEVRESGIYNRDISTVIVTPRHILLAPSAHVEWKYKLMCIERGRPINNYDNYRVTAEYYDLFRQAVPMNEERTLFATIRYNHAGTIEVRDDGSVMIQDSDTRDYKLSAITTDKDGVACFISDEGRICHFTGYNSVTVDMSLPAEFKGNLFAAYDGLSSIWLADESGLGNYSVASDGSVTVLRDKSVPSDAITVNEVCNMFPSNDPSRFYIANLGMNQIHPVGSSEFYTKRLYLNMVGKGVVSNINPTGATGNTSPGNNAINRGGDYIYSPTQIAEDPDYPERLFIGSGNEGLYVVEGDKVVLKIDGNNAPMKLYGNYYWGTMAVTIDSEGNLWVASMTALPDKSIIMLPAAKRRAADLSGLKSDDWIVPDYADFIHSRDIKLLFCRRSSMLFAIDSDNNRGFLAVDRRGTPGNVSDDIALVNSEPIDQDGKSFKPMLWTCMIEDKRGHVWMGSTSGVISITNPSKACDSDFRINRIKVPRNDGSGLADYLLESDKIVAMAVDNSNRKWIATAASGLFLVSEDGDHIISHFTTTNSPLPSNTITALHADPTGNSIFVGTLAGLYEYSSSSGPTKDDYSEVYAYPNPVTPDYSGWITIAGLMENSLVKIVDSSMNLVYQTTSEGGTALWDGCSMNGSRVRSGVYYVLASSSQGDSSYSSTSAGDVVAKIMVVN